MNSRILLNVGLLLAAAVLGVLVWLQPGKETKPKVLITDLKPGAVTHIQIEQPGQKKVELVKTKGAWRMTTPVDAPADGVHIDSLLQGIGEDSKSRYSAKGLDLSKYGLKPPKLSLWLNGERLDFGATEPLNNRRYVKVGNTIHIVSDMLYYRLAGDPMNFLSKHLLPGDARITALQLPDLTLSLDDKGKWDLQPARPGLSSDAIQKLVDAWRQTEALRVQSLAKDYKSAGEISVQLGGQKEPVRFAIVKDDSFFILARPDLRIEYEMTEADRQQLLKPGPIQSKNDNNKPAGAKS